MEIEDDMLHSQSITHTKSCIPIINCKIYNRKFKTPNRFLSFYIKLTHIVLQRGESRALLSQQAFSLFV